MQGETQGRPMLEPAHIIPQVCPAGILGSGMGYTVAGPSPSPGTAAGSLPLVQG